MEGCEVLDWLLISCFHSFFIFVNECIYFPYALIIAEESFQFERLVDCPADVLEFGLQLCLLLTCHQEVFNCFPCAACVAKTICLDINVMEICVESALPQPKSCNDNFLLSWVSFCVFGGFSNLRLYSIAVPACCFIILLYLPKVFSWFHRCLCTGPLSPSWW